ncbi:MAG: glycoside hydrolase family 20 zincin-like fold domain-containing protein, partial [Anaerolineae bacterium]|nr:glycoside hydrolase family 20 zincin-like fold domain-containing protein [Anaerolineae bacterium]
MAEGLLLLPIPRRLEYFGGEIFLPENKLIILNSADPPSLRFTAQYVQQALQQVGVNWPIVAGKGVPAEQIGLTLSVVPGGARHPQGYELTITPAGISIVAGTPAGIFYAVQTLSQILNQQGNTLSLLRISDWPDFPHRGV